MDLEVRRVRGGEWLEYRKLRLEALQDSPQAFEEQYAESVTRPDEFWQGRVDDSAAGPESSMFVAVHAGELVAKATCYVEDDEAGAKIVGVYVSPRFRGNGLAASLLTEAVRWAQEEARAKRIRLVVMRTNDRAARVYERLGFVRTGVTIPYPHDVEDEMEYQRLD